jgi:Ca-activated chloride channel family protein
MVKNNNNQLQVRVQLDKSVIPAGKTGKRIIELTLTAPPAPEDKPHIPLNLSLVIDRSGSMHGDKLKYVKEAAAHVIDLLSEKDRLAVILYDNEAETLMHSQFLTDEVKKELKAKLKPVRSGASTFLYGGWLTGCRQVAEAVADDTFNRTLLLTDGLANVGERDIGPLSVHAQELFTRGISTSCFGVGFDYDEHLLESMANHGGGSFHFLETLNAIPLVFEREFDEIISITQKDVKITLDLPAGVEPSVSANWHTEKEGNKYSIFLGSLMADQSQSIYLHLANLNGTKNQPIEIPIEVTGVDQDQSEHKTKSSITFTPVSASKESSIEQDEDMMERFAVVDLADKANEALKRERAGDRAGSTMVMNDALKRHHKNVSSKTREKYELFSSNISQGLDESERKRRHYQEYQSRRGYQSIGDYRVSSDRGPLMAEIAGQSVLINTGEETSLCRDDGWFFLDEVYRLPQSNNGMDCDQLSATIGKKVDVMLGMDILRDLYIRLDPGRRVIQFSRKPLRSRGRYLDLFNIEGVPSLEVVIDGKKVNVRLTTGLQFNYLPGDFVWDSLNVNEQKDILPGIQTFRTNLKTFPIQLRGWEINQEFGHLPEEIRKKLNLAAYEGVLGADFFRRDPITMEFPENKLIML